MPRAPCPRPAPSVRASRPTPPADARDPQAAAPDPVRAPGTPCLPDAPPQPEQPLLPAGLVRCPPGAPLRRPQAPPLGASGELPGSCRPLPTHAGTLGTLPSAWFPRSGRQVSPISPPSKFLCPSHGPRWCLPGSAHLGVICIPRHQLAELLGWDHRDPVAAPYPGARNPVFIYSTAFSAEGPQLWTAVAGDVCAESESPGGERERVLLGEPHLLGAAGAAEAAGREGGGGQLLPRGRVAAAPSGGPLVPCLGVWTPSHQPVICSDAKPGGRTFRVPVNP